MVNYEHAQDPTYDPELSIIIVNYNTFKLTSECIESVFSKTKDVTFEIILVDNASSECSARLFVEKFPNLTLIESAINVGFAKGNNLGIARARGSYILLLNSDILLTEDTIGKCLAEMKAFPEIGVLSPKLIYPSGSPQSVGNRFPRISNTLFYLTRTFKLLTSEQKHDRFLGEFVTHDKTLEVDWVLGAFFLTRRECIERLPNQRLSDDFFMYYEDVEWCFDISALGYRIVYFPAAQAIHYGSASFDTANQDEEAAAKKIRMIAQNESIFLRRAHGWLYQKVYALLGAALHLSVGNSRFAKINFDVFLGRVAQ